MYGKSQKWPALLSAPPPPPLLFEESIRQRQAALYFILQTIQRFLLLHHVCFFKCSSGFLTSVSLSSFSHVLDSVWLHQTSWEAAVKVCVCVRVHATSATVSISHPSYTHSAVTVWIIYTPFLKIFTNLWTCGRKNVMEQNSLLDFKDRRYVDVFVCIQPPHPPPHTHTFWQKECSRWRTVYGTEIG